MVELETLNKKITERRARIGYVGLGKMGLPSALMMADAGFNVVGVDVSEAVVSAVNELHSPYYEPEAEAYLARNRERFSASKDYEVLKDCDVIACAVPTIIDANRKTDYSLVAASFATIGKLLRKNTLVVFQSNVTPGVTEELVAKKLEENSGLKRGKDFLLAYVPIQAKAGQVFKDLKTYDRVVGGIDAASTQTAALLFRQIPGPKVIEASSCKVAELQKLYANVYKDISIAAANELANYCEGEGIDVYEVIRLCNTVPGIHILEPGIGVGGNCLPVDPYFYIERAKEIGVEIRLAPVARQINDERPLTTAKKIAALAQKKKARKTVLLGIAFRPNTHETAYSPALDVYRQLKKILPSTKAFDPLVGEARLRQLGVEVATEKEVQGAELLVKLVSHDSFKNLTAAIDVKKV